MVRGTIVSIMRNGIAQKHRRFMARFWAMLLIAVFSFAPLHSGVPHAMAHAGNGSHSHSDMAAASMPGSADCLMDEKSNMQNGKDICSLICDSLCSSHAVAWPARYASHQRVASGNFAPLPKRAVLPTYLAVEERPPRLV